MVANKFRYIWLQFQRRFLEIDQSETRIACGGPSLNKIFSSEIALPNEQKFGRKHPVKVLYKDCSFCPDSLTNMAATGNFCFSLADF
jgi:hypothetical protein